MVQCLRLIRLPADILMKKEPSGNGATIHAIKKITHNASWVLHLLANMEDGVGERLKEKQ